MPDSYLEETPLKGLMSRGINQQGNPFSINVGSDHGKQLSGIAGQVAGMAPMQKPGVPPSAQQMGNTAARQGIGNAGQIGQGQPVAGGKVWKELARIVMGGKL